MEIIKVSSRSTPKLVAGAIASLARAGGAAEVQAVGAGAANQAIKSVAIARMYLTRDGIDLVCRPAFTTVTIDGDEKTAIAMITSVAPDSKAQG